MLVSIHPRLTECLPCCWLDPVLIVIIVDTNPSTYSSILSVSDVEAVYEEWLQEGLGAFVLYSVGILGH